MISILNCINHGAAPVILLVVFSWTPLPVFVGAAAGRNLAGVPCGKSFSRSKHARIMGGTAANIVDFPYAISLQTARGEHFCGGSLVHRSFVVTAAHCVEFTPDMLLVAGDQNSAMMNAKTEQHLEPEAIFKHPDFSRGNLANDIAIIKLKEPVEWTEWVQPVCLPGPVENLKEGTSSYIAGWGLDSQYGEMTEELHQVELPIVDNEQCQNTMGSRINIRDTHICAGWAEGGKDGCQADSGGGLITLKSGHMIMSGVMMGGVGCGRPNLPGVYTRVQKFVKWIEDVVEENSSSLYRRKRDTNETKQNSEVLPPNPQIRNYIHARSERPQHSEF